MINDTDNCLTALLLGPYPEEREFVRGIFREYGWDLHECRDPRRAGSVLRRRHSAVVIAGPEHWRTVLHQIRDLPNSPQLVVTSRTADDALWSEVLNLGGYDVLAQPFDREEFRRVVDAAARHSQSGGRAALCA